MKILGGFDVGTRAFIEGADVRRIGALPGREALLGQLVWVLTSPIRSFLYILKIKSERS